MVALGARAYGKGMKRRHALAAASLLCALAPAASALAQDGPARPPAPLPVENPPLALYYILMLALVVGSLLLSIMPSKRGHHQD